MTTRELIALLRAVDPDGGAEVALFTSDGVFRHRLEGASAAAGRVVLSGPRCSLTAEPALPPQGALLRTQRQESRA